MESVLTLIAAPGSAALDEGMVADVRAALKDLGADTAAPNWLAPAEACDLPFAMLAPEQADALARHRLDGKPLDVVAQPVDGRRKRLLVADMDSTIVTGETLDELAAFAGLKDHIAAITARAMNGEIDFKSALRERVALLSGLSADTLEKTWDRISYTPGARQLVQTMRANGAYTVLVSGGFRFFTSRVRAQCGFDLDEANDLEIAGGKLTGRVMEPILDRETKLATLIRVAGERQLPLKMAASVGDGANDLGMIKAAGLGVAFRAKPVVAAEARVRIDHGDLTALLYAQGYRRDEFTG